MMSFLDDITNQILNYSGLLFSPQIHSHPSTATETKPILPQASINLWTEKNSNNLVSEFEADLVDAHTHSMK